MRGLQAGRHLRRCVQHAFSPVSPQASPALEALFSCSHAAEPAGSAFSACSSATCEQRGAGSGGAAPPPLPWPTRHRSLHCTASTRQQSAAQPQASQQQADGGGEDGSDARGAAAAATLSGMAVKLSWGDPFLVSHAEDKEGPIAVYAEGRRKGHFRKDDRQELTMEKIQRLYEDCKAALGGEAAARKGRGLTLVDAEPAPSSSRGGWFSGLFGARQESTAAAAPAVQGLYMYGGVGVGKTMLMDLMAKHAPDYFKLERTHFHDFMLEVHQRLRHFASKPDPLTHVADEIVDGTRVLCLDEFFVTDVADAMILHRLFARLWDRGLTLVATSNRHPDALYEGGLQRNLFLPFINRLKEQCEVHDMDSRTDYRRLAHHQRGLYFVTPSREEDLYERFMELTNGKPVGPAYVEVAMGRQLEMPRTGGCVTLFTFDELCNRPLGAADYIALANAEHTLALSGVPVFTAANRQAAYRFVTLVDVLYEHRVRFLCAAEAMPFELFENIQTQAEARAAATGGGGSYSSGLSGGSVAVVDDNLGFAKDRTVSRLTEMQSEEYLRAHAKAHAPELLLALTGSKPSSSSSSGGGQRR
ncbi:lactation elevated 1 isoform X1 [Micractinium conductrix]|uniref:Lactation elevated 1 isoform X1 n=1 Tax=Micractinium conductrix TaxID=554055 RepID=A0A2P6V0E5_9CHLO|nr:lactation elevated 1 isoform X1 [Micractinium conductrix]|eukprot:PSC67543.1 lactation elevated 1 isoform X1 [Micractinium conductrix]